MPACEGFVKHFRREFLESLRILPAGIILV
jgi:hypothetical protein